MTPDAATTTSTPAPQAPGTQASAPAGSASVPGAASGSQPAPASPAAQPTPVQLFWEVARMAFVLMTRLIQVLQPIQSYYLNQSRQIMRVCTEICRVMLTIRFAPERITHTQLRHLSRARHILQALFGYTLPLGARTPSSANATFNQSPSATPLGARTPSSATAPSPTVAAVPEVPEVPTVREVPEVPLVSGISSSKTSSAASFKAPAAPAPDPSHPSHTSHTSQDSHPSHSPLSALRAPHSPFSPYIPDVNTLVAAVRAATLPPNCAGALLENPGEALVRALHELHAVYFSLYPKSPSPVQSPSPSQSPSNPQSKGEDPVGLRDHNPQSEAPSVNPVHPVHSVHSPSPSFSQSEISNLKSEIPNPQSKGEDPVGLRDHIPQSDIPHSAAPP